MSSVGYRRGASTPTALLPLPVLTQASLTSHVAHDDAAMKSIFAKPPQHAASRHWLVVAAVGAVILVLWLVSGVFIDDNSGPSVIRKQPPARYRIGIITDLDKRSKTENGQWRATYMTGTLERQGDAFSVTWDAPADVFTSHNEAGRGAELSELLLYHGRLYTFDDRTGIMFEIVHPLNSGEPAREKRPALAPRGIFMEGDGATDKGLKIEWATVKDGEMVIGSFGKEFTDNAGNILHRNNLWVVQRRADGSATQSDWSPFYGALRAALQCEHPGYLLHEAVVWSPERRRWFVFPRRVSREAYDEVADELRGSNVVLTADEKLSRVDTFTVGDVTPRRGFSSAKFLPGTHDGVVVALKSEENSDTNAQTTYITVYAEDRATGAWRVAMPETEIAGGAKYEGVEVLQSEW